MVQILALTPDEFKERLMRRFHGARKYRELFEGRWVENYNIIMNAEGQQLGQFNLSFENSVELEGGEVDKGDAAIGMNYAFKHLRFFHSQLSANPPSVVVRPTTSDPIDEQRADAADRIARHGRRKEFIDEYIDEQNWDCLWSGNGWIKGIWNPDIGETYDFNEETGEHIMQGQIEYNSPAVLDMWIDPDAKTWRNVKYTFERHTLALEDSQAKWPEYSKILKENTLERDELSADSTLQMGSRDSQEPQVEIYEYYEKGLPINGGAGSHCYFLEDGTLLGEITKNPHCKAGLPYHLFTYLDIPSTVYGKSAVEYVSNLQDKLNKLDSSILDSIQAHGVIRFALPANAEIEDEAVSSSSWDYIQYTGDRPPSFINTPTLMPDIWKFRESLILAMQEIFGINDSMMGIQRREQSAVSQQTSIETGTMIHRRLWKKYSMNVESVFRDYLMMVRDNWKEPRMIAVLGKSKAFESAKFKGADISGGFDLDVEYGTSLPIDPNMRREAITLLTPLLKEAGMSAKAILQKMNLNDYSGIMDRMELSSERQKEDFDEMIASFRTGVPLYIAPKELQEHQGRLEYSYTYLETAEFKYLDEEVKALIEKQVLEREGFLKQQAAPDPAVLPAGSPGVGGAQGPSLGGGGTSAGDVTTAPQSLSGAGIV